MTELYDQDAEPKKSSFVRDLVIWLSVGALLGWGAVFAFDSYETWNEAKERQPDVNIASYMTQSVKWKSCDEDKFVPDDWQNKDFDSDAAKCASFKVPASYQIYLSKS